MVKDPLVIYEQHGIKLKSKLVKRAQTDYLLYVVVLHLPFRTFLIFKNHTHKTATLTHLIMWLAYAREQHVLYVHNEQWTYVG